MASYHFAVKSGKKGKATNHAAYIARQGKFNTEEAKSDLVEIGHGNLPDWSEDNPMTLWKTADTYERSNAAVYREYTFALPKELSTEAHLEIVHEIIKTEVGHKPYLFAIHSPPAALGHGFNPHCHLMFSDRIPDSVDRPPSQHFRRYNPKKPEVGGCKKDSGGKDPREVSNDLISKRERIAQIQNAALSKYGHDTRVDHRSNKARGIEREPEHHLGSAGIKKMTEEDKTTLKTRRKNEEPKTTALK